MRKMPVVPMVLLGSGAVAKGQCSISGPGSSVSGLGNTLTLSLAVTFSSNFAGSNVRRRSRPVIEQHELAD